MSAFGELLRELRLKRGLTQQALAAGTGGAVSASLIAHIELGRRGASHDSVDALADALKVSSSDRARLHAARKADKAAPPRSAIPATPSQPGRIDTVSVAGLSPEQRMRVLGYIDALREENR